jgi:hypothetical protein
MIYYGLIMLQSGSCCQLTLNLYMQAVLFVMQTAPQFYIREKSAKNAPSSIKKMPENYCKPSFV